MNADRLKRYHEVVIEKKTLDSIRRELDTLKGAPTARNASSSKRRAGRSDAVGHGTVTRETVDELIERKKNELENELKAIEAAIETLSPLMRAILRLRYIERLPWWKIANRVGYSKSQAQRYHDAAIEELKKI